MGKALKPLSGLDAGFLYLESAGTPMHVGSLMLLDLPKRRGYDFHRSLTALLKERLGEAPVLRRVLVEAPLNTLGAKELCPGTATLARINASLR